MPDMTTLHYVRSSPVLEATASNGRKKFWQAHIGHNRDVQHVYYTLSWSWNELKGGGVSKTLVSEPYESKPMNQGRANERTSRLQADLEFNAMVEKKRTAKSYREAGEAASDRPSAMLAKQYEDFKDRVTFPCYVQRKYNGQRMLLRGPEAWSRGNKDVLPAAIAHLGISRDLTVTFDGELMLPGNQPLQRSMSAIKKYHAGVTEQLEYLVYDLVDIHAPFEARLAFLRGMAEQTVFDGVSVRLAPTARVDSREELEAYYQQYVTEGFEGIMVRDAQSNYEAGQRSRSLLKLKPEAEVDCTIIDVVPMGGGSASNLGKLVCRTPAGVEFKVNVEGDAYYRRQMLAAPEVVIGRCATVAFQDYTEDGKPTFARVTNIRDWVELS